jgi:hypothetical protein
MRTSSIIQYSASELISRHIVSSDPAKIVEVYRRQKDELASEEVQNVKSGKILFRLFGLLTLAMILTVLLTK